ncbi:MAG: hypothetical protein ACO395_07720 [Pontimonas sp.]
MDAVTATGAGGWYDTQGRSIFTIVYTSASVTSGGTLKIQGKTAGGTVYDIDTQTITSDTTTAEVFTGAHYAIRANLTARTDGTFTAELEVV